MGGLRVGGICCVDGATGGDAVAFHGRNDDVLREGSEAEHEHQQDHRREHGAGLVDVPRGRQSQQCEGDNAGDEADAVQDAEQRADYKAGRVLIRRERGEGDGGDDREEDFRAEPDDEREVEQGAEKGLHEERIQERGLRDSGDW